MESTDKPAGPLVSGVLLVGWAEWADSTTFSEPSWRRGYGSIEVDAFREEIRDTFLGATRSAVRADNVRGTQFPSTNDRPGYDKKQVDAFLDAAGIRLAAMESTDRPAGCSSLLQPLQQHVLCGPGWHSPMVVEDTSGTQKALLLGHDPSVMGERPKINKCRTRGRISEDHMPELPDRD